MFVAYDDQGCLVNLLDGLKAEATQYTCPSCHQLVCLKRGQLVRPHFAHRRQTSCLAHQENESAEHLDLKALLYRNLKASGQSVAVEVGLPDLGLVADVLVNQRLVLEVQCSRISSDRLLERTRLYRQAGYQVVWLLGRQLWLARNLSSLHKACLGFSQNMGFHLWEVDGERQELRLRYLLHEDLRGRAWGHSRCWSLARPLLPVLRQPYLSQAIAPLRVAQDPDPVAYIQRQIFQGHGKWLTRQAQAYQEGDNLLTKQAQDFYPQVRPVMGDLPQVEGDLATYYRQFENFYKNQGVEAVQRLYPPRFYAIMEGRLHRKD